ncbi:MAG: hypothetical protein ACK5OB_15820 [Pirellula sp.]
MTTRILPNHDSHAVATAERILSGRWLPVALIAWMSIAMTGCSTVMMRSKSSVDNLDTRGLKVQGYSIGNNGVQRAGTPDEASPSVILEVNDGKRSVERVPLPAGQPMFVADLVRDAQLTKKLGRIQIKILRANGNRPPVRLDVDFDDNGKRIMEEMNYSLRPGDHVVVMRDERTLLNRLTSGSVFTGSKE